MDFYQQPLLGGTTAMVDVYAVFILLFALIANTFSKKQCRAWRVGLMALGLACASWTGWGQTAETASLQTLHNHVRAVVAEQRVKAASALPSDQKLALSIVLPLRNQDQLKSLLQRLHDPSSSDYRKFLTVDQFTAQFAPTEADYQKVVDFATSNGFTVTGRPTNRMIVPVTGTVAQINSAFHVSMNLYPHPSEDRSFYSPDREPSVALSVPLAHVDGMNNYSLPQSMMVKGDSTASAAASTVTGSGPNGSYLGSDMRAAYYNAGTLTGAGQTVAMIEFGGYRQSDVDLSFSNAGQSYSVAIENELVGSATNTVYSSDAEHVLDIVQAIGMAPGLSKVLVYIADPYSSSSPALMLNQIATDNTARQISCSWGWLVDDISSQDQILEEMAAQGQSFLAASGDYGAYQYSVSPYFYPAESAYATAVGGTHLTTASAAGAWSGESAWTYSGGGVSPDGLGLPSWQTGVANTNNGGSSTLRNVPDIAMEGDFDNYYCALGTCRSTGGGTSFATPRWAAFIAMANEQAAGSGSATTGLGLLNPALYTIATGSDSATDYHDVTSGNNDAYGQTTWYSAVSGYDLVTGWGTPTGQSMINALAGASTDGFWLSSSVGTLSTTKSSTATATITVNKTGSFTDSVALAVSSTLPAGMTAAFGTSSTTSNVLTVTTDATVAAGTYPVTVTGTAGTVTQSTTFDVVVHGPSFSLTTTSTSLSLSQGGSATTTVTVSDQYGFADNVTLAVSGLPTGVTASLSKNPTATTSVLTLTASSTAAAWSGSITITGTSGTLTASKTMTVSLVAPSFTLNASSATLTQGKSAASSIYVYDQNGFNGNVTLSVSGLPTGVSAQFSPNPTASSSELTLLASSTATVGDATVTITGTSGTFSTKTTMTLSVKAPSFTLSNTISLSMGTTSGSTMTDWIYVNDLYGFSGNVTLSVAGLPTGVSAKFATNPVSSTGQMTLTSDGTAVAGSYPLTITGTSGSLTATTSTTLTLGVPSFTLSTNASTVTVAQNGSQSNAAYVTDQFGFSGSVALTTSTLPTGLSVSFSPTSTTYYSSITVTASSATAAGTYPITITGTSGSITKTTTMNVVVTAPSFTMSSSNETLGIGKSASSTIGISGVNGFSGAVSLSIAGLPAGVTPSFSPSTTSGGSSYASSTLTLTAASTTVADTYTVTVTGVSGTATASTSFKLTVAAPSFALSSISTLTIGQGSSGSTYVNTTANNGFSTPISLSVTGNPSGMTVNFVTSPLTPGYSTLINLAVDSSVAVGTYPIKITGTADSQTQMTMFDVVVVAPSFTLSPATSNATVNPGASTSSYVSYGSSTYNGAVNLTASGAPAGVTVTLSPSTLASSYMSSTVTVAVGSAAAAGTYPITITGTVGTLSSTATLNLTVTAQGFTLTAAPSKVYLAQGKSENISVGITDLNGFAGSIALAVSGLPTGVTGTWSQSTATSSSVLTLAADSTATTGTTTATITGTSGALTQTVLLPVSIVSSASAAEVKLVVTAAGSEVENVSSGTAVTLNAVVTQSGRLLVAGTVNFCEGTTGACSDMHLLGSAQLTSAGMARLTLVPSPGVHLYRAVFVGSPKVSPTTSATATLTVASGYATTSTLTATGATGAYTLQSTVTGTAATAPSGTVSFLDTSNNNTLVGTATLGTGSSSIAWPAGSLQLAGYEPTAQTVADFNGDGLMDVAVLNYWSGSITLLLGNADGTLSAMANSPAVSMLSSGQILHGDWNNDGIADLAVLDGTGAMTSLLGKGDGTFTVAQTLASNTYVNNAERFVAGDFNGDGNLDLLFAESYSAGYFHTLLGNGDGTFTAAPTVAFSGTMNALAVGDFNGDGALDLVAINGSNSSSVMTMLGDGAGNFSVMGSTTSLSNGGSFLTVVDLDHDGKLDLVVTSTSGSVVTLLGAGDGSFAAPTTLTSSAGYATKAIAGDFTLDGNVDLLVPASYSSTAQIFYGKGDGTLTQSASTLSLQGYATASELIYLSSNRVPAVVVSESANNAVEILQPVLTQTATAATSGIDVKGVGAHAVVARYQGDTAYNASTSSAASLTGSRITPAIVWATPSSIAYGTALGANQLNATASVDGTFTYSVAAGTVLDIGSYTLTANFTPADATSYTTATASVTLSVVQAPQPTVIRLSPAFTTAGTSAFTITVTGTGFTSSSKLYWGATALSTTYVNATTLTAQVPAASVATAGISSLAVQNPTASGGNSTTFQFETDPTGAVAASFGTATATVAAGATAGYTVTLPTGASGVAVQCLNLPTGTSCSYANGQLSIVTGSGTPKGTYQVTAVFTETLPGAASAWLLLPFGLLPLVAGRRRRLLLTLGLLLAAAALQLTMSGCGGGSGSGSSSGSTTTQTHSSTSTGAVTLVVQ